MTDNNSRHVTTDGLKIGMGHRCIIDASDLVNDSSTDLEQTQSVALPGLKEILTPSIKPITVTPHSTAQRSLNL